MKTKFSYFPGMYESPVKVRLVAIKSAYFSPYAYTPFHFSRALPLNTSLLSFRQGTYHSTIQSVFSHLFCNTEFSARLHTQVDTSETYLEICIFSFFQSLQIYKFYKFTQFCIAISLTEIRELQRSIETYDMRYFPQHVLLCTSAVRQMLCLIF